MRLHHRLGFTQDDTLTHGTDKPKVQLSPLPFSSTQHTFTGDFSRPKCSTALLGSDTNKIKGELFQSPRSLPQQHSHPQLIVAGGDSTAGSGVCLDVLVTPHYHKTDLQGLK